MSRATGRRFGGKASVAAALAQNFVMFVFIVIAFFNVMMMFVLLFQKLCVTLHAKTHKNSYDYGTTD